jgi:hypothetical protein
MFIVFNYQRPAGSRIPLMEPLVLFPSFEGVTLMSHRLFPLSMPVFSATPVPT